MNKNDAYLFPRCNSNTHFQGDNWPSRGLNRDLYYVKQNFNPSATATCNFILLKNICLLKELEDTFNTSSILNSSENIGGITLFLDPYTIL